MVINYKKEEEQHYDGKAHNRIISRFSYSDFVLKSSSEFYYKLIHEKLAKRNDFKILDYGSGSGEKHYQFANSKNHITGIDISFKSIEIANQKAKELKLNAEYQVMDCEKMTFPDDTFDVILDFGSFSSLNMDIAVKELARVLSKDGTMICIETYGHNPFMKVKRLINVILRKRTKWAAQHIMKKQSWEILSKNFESFSIYYFHFIVLFLPYILRVAPKSYRNKILSFAEKIDTKILRIKCLQFLAFKTVVVFNKPK
jgi:ubiquinone/menaquinone biosynthesis C-methylase UbiE